MTKSKLKTGMIVTTRDGNEYMVFKDVETDSRTHRGNVLVNINKRLWDDFDSYDENMICKHDSNFDIMKVKRCQVVADLLHDQCAANTIWERKEKKRYTYAQLREILGEEFEVVG